MTPELHAVSQERKSVGDLAALRINREPERSGGARGWLLLLAVIVVAAGAAAYFLGGKSLRPTRVEAVTASIVTEGQATTLLTATGYVEAERKADLSPKITSRIVALNVTEGSKVRKDDIIARLDDTDLSAQLAEAEANYVNAKAELARQQSLYDQGLSPKSTLDAAIASDRATKARADYVRALIDYTVIRAPFAGVITAKRAFVGEAVSPFGSSPSGGGSGGAIVTLVEFSSLYVGADVNEANLSRIGPKQPAEITLDAVQDKTYHGYLRQIVPAADRQKATVRVKVAFLDADERILPDLSARVAFTAEATKGDANRSRVLIPRAALVTKDGASGVFRIVDGRAKFQTIEAAGDVQGQIEVKKGLQGGERLIAVAAGSSLRDGDRIRIEGEKE
ncbi:MAG TPA: efflux RND transporter periplasmic adaptor subunit [Thermoanaerobaculia bacterium]|nr:efflux RND transporter periplasmic adaptor subunit [Thermoanaerobaculia bacterium]